MDLPGESLHQIILRYGRSIIDEPHRLESLLKDYCGQNKREVNIIVHALQDHIPQDLLQFHFEIPPSVFFARLTQKLAHNHGLSTPSASWAVTTWANALEIAPSAVPEQQPVLEAPVSQLFPAPAPLPPVNHTFEKIIVNYQTDFSKGKRMVIPIASDTDLIFINIQGGDFWLGSDRMKDANSLDEEKPLHKINLNTYWIGKYPITNKQFEVFLRSSGYTWKGSIPNNKPDHPVTNITWRDSRAFCQWLKNLTNLDVRLPTEAEWEKAARGNDARIFPWGNQSNLNYANYFKKFPSTTPVGQFSPFGDSPYSVSDMAGNVFEWTSTVFRAYPYNPNDGREEMIGEFPRVLRGGAFNNHWNCARCAFRYRNFPNFSFSNIGFRVAFSNV